MSQLANERIAKEARRLHEQRSRERSDRQRVRAERYLAVLKERPVHVVTMGRK